MLATDIIYGGYKFPGLERNGSPLCALPIRTGSRSDRVGITHGGSPGQGRTRSLPLPVLTLCNQTAYEPPNFLYEIRVRRELLNLRDNS